MPKLPAVTGRELLRALRKLGFGEHRQRGTSHLVMKHPDGRRTVIPIHPGHDIPKGTLRAILRDIDITLEQIDKML